jgi:hypothetical protein
MNEQSSQEDYAYIIANSVIGIAMIANREVHRHRERSVFAPTETHLRYIVTPSTDSGVGAHFDISCYAREESGEFRKVLHAPMLTDSGEKLFNKERKEMSVKEERRMWLETFRRYDGKIEFEYNGAPVEMIWNDAITKTDSVGLGKHLGMDS